MRLALLLLFSAINLSAQLTDIVSQSNRLQLLLQKIKPQDWPAGSTYVELWQATLKDNLAVAAAAQALAAHPDQIVESLNLLEQLHTVQESVSALSVGVAKYQNAALAELIAGIQAEGKPARDTYREHVLQLVADREEQFQTADHEAQRCRAILSKDPHAAHGR